tara:strand:- start:242 stop:655 length:414 start_codon:yes stop_codon:yes gene_type:complete
MSTSDVKIDEDIWERIQSIFAEALGLEEEEVTYDSKLIEDLEAESIDLLDILYQLDREFNIKIPRGGLENIASSEDPENVSPDGTLTPLALERLQEAMPEVPAEELIPGLKPADVPKLFRVATFYNLVVELIKQQNG